MRKLLCEMETIGIEQYLTLRKAIFTERWRLNLTRSACDSARLLRTVRSIYSESHKYLRRKTSLFLKESQKIKTNFAPQVLRSFISDSGLTNSIVRLL
jgi:hypothetical protein